MASSSCSAAGTWARTRRSAKAWQPQPLLFARLDGATGALRTPTELEVLRQLKSARGTSFIASAVEAKSHSTEPHRLHVSHTHTHVPVSGIWLSGVP